MNRRAKASCRVWCLSVFCLCFITLTASGTPIAILESSYLGDGWFQYTLTNLQDPYFQEADITVFDVPLFTNFLAYGADPVDWQSVSPNIAYALGSPPSTTWTSAVPLDAYGNVFRLALVATQQDSNLVNNAGTMTQSPMSQPVPVSADATVSGCRIGGGGIVEATIVTESGCSYEVYLSGKSGERCQEQTFTATTSTTTVQFRPEGITSPAIIKVLRLSPG